MRRKIILSFLFASLVMFVNAQEWQTDLNQAKAQAAEAAGADTLMELGTGGDFLGIRKKVCDAISLSVGSADSASR